MEQDQNRAVGSRDGLGGGWVPAAVPTHPVTYAKMLPCPYCTAQRATLEVCEDRYRVHCCVCEASSSVKANPVLAITVWNNVARYAAS